MGEQYVRTFGRDALIIRTSAVFSEHGKSSFLHKILAQAVAGKSIKVTGSHTCQPTYASDLAEYIVYRLENWGVLVGIPIINFANKSSIRFDSFASTIVKYAGLTCPVEGYASQDLTRPFSPHLDVQTDCPSYVYSLRHCIENMKREGLL